MDPVSEERYREDAAWFKRPRYWIDLTRLIKAIARLLRIA